MRSLLIPLLLGAAALCAACQSPRTQANIAQALNDAGAQISAIQQDVAVLQGQVDSLRQVLARQDTIIGRLATLNNIPISR